MVVQGYKRALVRDDLWNINADDKCRNVIPVFNKQWDKELTRCRRYNSKIILALTPGLKIIKINYT